jgi:mono/diheme cytochrome c family protein
VRGRSTPQRSAWLALGLLAVLASSCAFLRGYAEGRSQSMEAYQTAPAPGFFRLVFDDFQGLNTDTMARSAAPWKVLGVAVVHVEQAKDPSLPMTEASLRTVLHRRFGFQTPARIGNWPAEVPQVPLEKPLGIVAGTVSRSLPEVQLEVYNTGCSTCHASNLFDEKGQPTDVAWVGLPTSSLNLDAYGATAFQGLQWAAAHPDDALEAVKQMFPNVSEAELSSLRRFYLPRLKDPLALVEKSGRTSFIPFGQGGTGLTNGAATVQNYLGLVDTTRFHSELTGYVQMPELGGLKLRRSILIDGVYAPPGMKHTGAADAPGSVAHRDGLAGVSCLVTLGTLGVEPSHAVNNQPRMRDVMDFAFDRYEPPPFPGAVDAALAARGQELFAAHCQSCHGKYEESQGRVRLVSFPNTRAAMGTDRARLDAINDAWLGTLTSTALGQVLHAERADEYVAPPLTGLWATAPYFHNGSVPTLWHLMHPEQRPARFMVGGHALDYAKGGIAGAPGADGTYRFPEGYAPWVEPTLFDSTTPGHGNAGHERPFDKLDEEQKRALLEYLKRL